MDFNDLVRLVLAGEGTRVEFKGNWPKQATDVAREMAAFANTEGGTLIFGVEDDKTIRGVGDADDTMKRIAGLAQNTCHPALHPTIGSFPIGGDRYVAWATVATQRDTPCMVEGRIYVRVGPTCEALRDANELKRFFGGLAPKAGQRSRIADTLPAIPPISKGFRGRAEDSSSLLSYLSDNQVSIIAIEGISGIGKTALAAYVATQVVAQGYKAFWVDCRAEVTLDSIGQDLARIADTVGDTAVADMLDDTHGSQQDRVMRMVGALTLVRYALFFDDFHLALDPAVDEFLARIEERGYPTKVFLIARRRPRALGNVRLIGLAEQLLTMGLDVEASGLFLKDCGVSCDEETAREIWAHTGQGHPKALQIFAVRARQ